MELLRTLLLLLLCAGTATAEQCGGGGGGDSPDLTKPITCSGKFPKCCAGAEPGLFTCIGADETCCSGTACVDQSTYCCPKMVNPACPGGDCPARCCPHWTVCCTQGGRDGCCSPFEAELQSALGSGGSGGGGDRAAAAPPVHVGNSEGGSEGPTGLVYALFLESGAAKALLKVLAIDVATGETVSTKVVAGYSSVGGMTRMFEFNRATNSFVSFENDFAKPAPRAVAMVTISALTGAMKTTVLDRVGFPTGYKYDDATRQMVLATGAAPTESPGEDTSAPFRFYSVSDAGETELLSETVPRRSSGGSPQDPMAGWIHAVSGNTSFRAGFRNVSLGASPGLGVTDLRTGSSEFSPRAAASSHSGYLSLDAADGGSRLFSLAPQRSRSASLDLISWGGSRPSDERGPPPQPTVLATLGDAHQPAMFGDVAATLRSSDGTWAALTVQHPGVILTGGWALSVVANVTDEHPVVSLRPIRPRVGGGACSLSGIGLPDEQPARSL
jgi:hypothetical protein